MSPKNSTRQAKRLVAAELLEYLTSGSIEEVLIYEREGPTMTDSDKAAIHRAVDELQQMLERI